MKTNRSMPASAVIPVLSYPDVRQAVDWLCRSFGFTERLQVEAHRAQLTIGEGALMVAAAADAGAATRRSPPVHAIMVRVTDVDRHHEQAKKGGALIVSPPSDYPYGERQYTAEDLGGHLWTFSQTVADVSPETWGGVLHEKPAATPRRTAKR